MSRIRRSREALAADLPGGKVILEVKSRKPYILNETASAIWDYCETPKSSAEIADYLAKRYNITSGRARKDAGTLIKVMKKKGIFRQ